MRSLKRSALCDVTPRSLLKINQSFGGACRLHLRGLLATCFMLVSCLAYSSTLKMEARCFSETSVDFQRTTRRYIPEDRTLHNHRCENLRAYNEIPVSMFLLNEYL
jgi:hypothetical protein